MHAHALRCCSQRGTAYMRRHSGCGVSVQTVACMHACNSSAIRGHACVRLDADAVVPPGWSLLQGVVLHVRPPYLTFHPLSTIFSLHKVVLCLTFVTCACPLMFCVTQYGRTDG
eukprot:350708-Chlamydomonas_euryale.AAC.6